MTRPFAGPGPGATSTPAVGSGSSTDADIAVVVVTYQSASTIEDCLARLRAADGVGAIRVVDNRSTDGGLEIIQRDAAADPRVRFIANPDNPGFAVACNQGAADVADSAPQCRWLAFVNPDALVEVDTLSRLRALAEAGREHGAGPAGAIQTPPDIASADETGIHAGTAGTAEPSGRHDTRMLLGVDLVDEDGKRDTAARRRDPDFSAMFVSRLPRMLRPKASNGVAGAEARVPLDVPVQSGGGASNIGTGAVRASHTGDTATPVSEAAAHDPASPINATATSAGAGEARANLTDRGASVTAAASAGSLAIAPDDSRELQPVGAISGALMFMPRRLFEQIGGFDESYRLHAEDLDLCRRAAAAGASVAVANRVRVVHVRGVSSRSNPWFVEWHKHRGLWRYFGKFEAARRGPLLRAAVFAAIWSRFPFAIGRALLRRR